MRTIPILCTLLLAAAAAGQPLDYDRMVRAQDLTYSPNPGGGWTIHAPMLAGNATPSTVDLSSIVTVLVNGIEVGSSAVSNVAPSWSCCGGSSVCPPDGNCIGWGGFCACFIIHLSTGYPVASLSPGDVITARVAAAPGAAPEPDTSNDEVSVVVQNYDRIISPGDITIAPDPGGAGWVIRATAWLASEEPAPMDLGSTLAVYVNGELVSSVSHAAMVSAGPGASGCASSCITDGWCAACKESIIIPGTCYCSNNSVSTEFTVPSLAPGDVVAAGVTALPGSAAEIAAANDRAFIVVPTPGGHNRAIKPTGIHYGRTAAGTFAIAGEVEFTTDYDGTDRDLSYDVLVLVNGTPVGGGGGGGGCGGTAIITVGAGNHIGGIPPLFDCSQWCIMCQYTLGNPNGNLCYPPNISEGPFCFCDTNCSTARIVPGNGWQVDVPQLSSADAITVIITPHPGSLPEFDTSDDSIMALVADITLCEADFDANGTAAVGDIFSMLAAWFAGQMRCDFNGSGNLDIGDIFRFLAIWFGGCA